MLNIWEKNGLLEPECMEDYILTNEGSSKLDALRADFDSSRLITMTDFMYQFYERNGTYEPLVKARQFWRLYTDYLPPRVPTRRDNRRK